MSGGGVDVNEQMLRLSLVSDAEPSIYPRRFWHSDASGDGPARRAGRRMSFYNQVNVASGATRACVAAAVRVCRLGGYPSIPVPACIGKSHCDHFPYIACSSGCSQVMERLPLGRKRPATISDLGWNTEAASAAPTDDSAQPAIAWVDGVGDGEHAADPSASRSVQNDSPEAGPQAARFDGSASASGAPLPPLAQAVHVVVFLGQSLHHRANQLPNGEETHARYVMTSKRDHRVNTA